MGKAFPWLAAIMLATALSACGGPAHWTKDGVSPDQTAAEYADCRHQAQRDIQRDVNIDTDIAAGRDHDWDHSQTAETHTASNASSNARLNGNIVSSCMESKGYAPSGPEATEGPHWWTMLDM
jgi:hypothetical protein